MGRRIGQLAGALAFVMAMGRLGRLLEAGPQYPQWQAILVASTFLGAVVWWLIDQLTTRRAVRLVVLGGAGLVLALRITAPETLTAGILPTSSTIEAMGSQLDLAFRIIRSGVPPVVPHPGLVSILAVVMWVVGALFSWGYTRGPYAAMFLPSLVMYFQFAVFDRVEAGMGWLGASALVLGISVLAMALERRQETGRARDVSGHPMARRATGLAVAMAAVLGVGSLTLAGNASTVIDEYGNKWWGGGSGFGSGSGGGGVRFDGLVDLRQRVINRSRIPLFKATVSGNAPAANEIYWRMATLDVFDGETWRRSDPSLEVYQPDQPLATDYDVYQGTSYDFLQLVQIDELDSYLAPTAGVPLAIQNPPDVSETNPRRPTEFHSFPDASLMTPSGLDQDDTYQVRSLTADRTADIGALATGEDGQLTPMFRNAAADGVFLQEPRVVDREPAVPPNLDFYRALPDNTPSALRGIAAARVRGATTDYEKAWLLQAWFRDSGAFTYSTDVDTGHDALILADWLTDPASTNYRTGYCEQFAAAMAVLTRALAIPSRVVWGFTPGEVSTQQDGTQLITVRDTNAHAWVEVWLDPYGWVQFDPTPRNEFQPPSVTDDFDPTEYVPEIDTGADLPRPEDNSGLGEDLGQFGEEPPVGLAPSPRWWLIGIVGSIPILGLVPLVKRIRRRRRLARVRRGDITAAWDEIVDRLMDLGEDLPASYTPLELARSTDMALLPLARSYSSTVYGGRSGQAQESDLFVVEWWIDQHFDGPSRARAAINPRSLLRRE